MLWWPLEPIWILELRNNSICSMIISNLPFFCLIPFIFFLSSWILTRSNLKHISLSLSLSLSLSIWNENTHKWNIEGVTCGKRLAITAHLTIFFVRQTWHLAAAGEFDDKPNSNIMIVCFFSRTSPLLLILANKCKENSVCKSISSPHINNNQFLLSTIALLHWHIQLLRCSS